LIRSVLLKLQILLFQKEFGNNKIKYIFEKHKDSDALVVVFSGFSAVGEPAKYNYMRALQELRVNKLFILDDFGYQNRGGYYLVGREAADESLPDEICRLISRFRGNRRLITAGSSKGGSAALLYGVISEAEDIIVGAPQYYIGDYLSTEEHLNILQGICGNTSSDSIKYLNNVLPSRICSADNKAKPAVYLHCSPQEHTYEEHVKGLLEDLENHGFRVYGDFDHSYSEHSCVGKYFAGYLQETLKESV